MCARVGGTSCWTQLSLPLLLVLCIAESSFASRLTPDVDLDTAFAKHLQEIRDMLGRNDDPSLSHKLDQVQSARHSSEWQASRRLIEQLQDIDAADAKKPPRPVNPKLHIDARLLSTSTSAAGGWYGGNGASGGNSTNNSTGSGTDNIGSVAGGVDNNSTAPITNSTIIGTNTTSPIITTNSTDTNTTSPITKTDTSTNSTNSTSTTPVTDNAGPVYTGTYRVSVPITVTFDAADCPGLLGDASRNTDLRTQLRKSVASGVSVAPSRVNITSMRCGSLIVDFSLIMLSNDTNAEVVSVVRKFTLQASTIFTANFTSSFGLATPTAASSLDLGNLPADSTTSGASLLAASRLSWLMATGGALLLSSLLL